jgi:hypothetical protein
MRACSLSEPRSTRPTVHRRISHGFTSHPQPKVENYACPAAGTLSVLFIPYREIPQGEHGDGLTQQDDRKQAVPGRDMERMPGRHPRSLSPVRNEALQHDQHRESQVDRSPLVRGVRREQQARQPE